MTGSSTGGEHTQYRAFFPIVGDALQGAQQELALWLKGKSIPIDPHRSGAEELAVGNKRFHWQLRVAHLEGGHEALDFLMTEEEEGQATFHTQLVVRQAPMGSWAFLNVTNDQYRFTGTPRLAKQLLKALDVRDAGVRVTGVPTRLAPGDLVEPWIELMLAQERRLPLVVVASGEGLTLEEQRRYEDKVSSWTRSLAGQAHILMLSPDATTRFNDRLPRAFHAQPWTIRTYRPEVDLTSHESALASRSITRDRLLKASDRQLHRLLIGIARGITQSGAPPAVVARTRSLIARAERSRKAAEDREESKIRLRQIRESAERQQREDALPELSGELARSVLEALGEAHLTQAIIEQVLDVLTSPPVETVDASLEAEVDALQEQLSDLNYQLELSRMGLEESESELAEAHAEVDKRDRKIDYLTGVVQEHDPAKAFSYVDEDPHAGIEDILDVCERVAELKNVRVTWDEDTVLGLAERDSYGVVARNAWSSLLTLERWGERWLAGDRRPAHDLIAEVSVGGITPRKVILGESDATMNQFGHTRVFRVPTTVDPSGLATMEAHIRVSTEGTVSPRMHFLDDLARTGKIYVGYLGPHLPNTQTQNA